MREVLRGHIMTLADHWFTVISGALLAIVMPVRGFALTIAAIVILDVFLGWQIARKRRGRRPMATFRSAILRAGNYFATLVVTQAFENTFTPGVPLTFIIGTAVAWYEFLRIRKKLKQLHGIDIGAILTSIRGKTTDTKGGGGVR